MRNRLIPSLLATGALVTAVVTGCTDAAPSIDAQTAGTLVAPTTTRIPHAPDEPYTLTTLPQGELVYASGPDTFVAIDRASGARRFERPASLLAADGSDLFTTEVVGSMTNVVASDPRTGDPTWSTTLTGAFVGEVVGPRGRQLALVPADAPSGSLVSPEAGYLAPSRTSSSVVVVSTAGAAPRRYDLQGNYAPEAFAADGTALFLVEFTPATNPDHYRVQRLDLTTGVVDGVYGNNKELQGSMPGRSRMYVSAPDGHARYTLYTMLMPATGHDPAFGHPPGPPHAGGETHDFVHVLDVVNGTATCVDLPTPFGLQDPKGLAIAASPSGAWFVVVDTDTGVVGVVDALSLALVTQAPIEPLAAVDDSQTALAATADGRLVVARGSQVRVMDTSGKTLAEWTAPGPVDGLTAAAGAPVVYASVDGRILTFDLDGAPRGEVGVLS